MIKNYLTTALRIMLRQKAYSAINVAGLSIGIAATLLIMLYIADELSYDKFHRDANLIYRVSFSGRLQGNEIAVAASPSPVAEAMQKEIPEVAEVVRFGLWNTMPLTFGEKSFTEERVLPADSNFFKFFSFAVVAGNPATFLQGPNKIVLTESAAKRYFGNDDPLGKIVLRGSDKTATEVSGVVKDAPRNSHIQFDAIVSGESWKYMKDTQWTSNNLYTYFKIHPAASVENVTRQLNTMAEKNVGAELERLIGVSFTQFRQQGNDLGLNIRSMLDIHLTSHLQEEIAPNGDIQYLYVFGAIAAFIILIACINFMNLSTARSANRAKEVGVRKTVGAFRARLIVQFLSESTIYSVLSMVLALVIIGISLTAFNLLTDKQLTMGTFANPLVIAALLVFALIVGLLAGSYPAFYLTSFKPTEVLKGKVRAGFKNSTLRNVLVVFQFMISITLIFGSLVVYRQVGYLQAKNIGFDKENIVNLLHTKSLGTNAQAFKNELNANPLFKGASFANNIPPNISWNSAYRKGGSDQDFLLYVYYMDYDHLQTMGYEMAEGRFFSRDFKSDTAAAILNETAYQQMGFTNLEEAEVLSYQGEKPAPLKVIGVLKDINFRSLKDEVKPMILHLGAEPNYEMAIRFSPGNTQQQLAALETIWKKYAAGTPFQYSFLDQNFDDLFRAEQRIGQIIFIFTLLAIGIACLGLFGLAAYTAEQRAKEISIRKVMGASVAQVMVLMSKGFTMLVFVAFVIAMPIAWYFSESWLQGFANRIEVDASMVIVSGVLSVLIALLTISYQSLRAARESPAKAMRSE